MRHVLFILLLLWVTACDREKREQVTVEKFPENEKIVNTDSIYIIKIN